MSRLVDSLSRWYGRVEILARGADELRRQARDCLERGQGIEARALALKLLERVPRSPVALALWADAADACMLDQEVVEALRQLVQQVPWRHDAWLRLGRVGQRFGWPGARDALERAAGCTDDRSVAREALLSLCDLDLQAGEPNRARQWLERIPSPADPTATVQPANTDQPDREKEASSADLRDAEVALRRAECWLATNQLDRASEAVATLGPAYRPDGRDRLIRAALAAQRLEVVDVTESLPFALGAYILEAPRATALLTTLVAASRRLTDDEREQALETVRTVLDAQGELDRPRWKAAFALAYGQTEQARPALLRLLHNGDEDAGHALLALATDRFDLPALRAVAEADIELLSPGLRMLLDALARAPDRDGQTNQLATLEALESVCGTEAEPWAKKLHGERLRQWVPELAKGEPAAWPQLLTLLRRAAWTLDRYDLIESIEALAVELERPLRVAVLGEFNAGKSTLLNALLGTDVAPTGAIPTTSSLHWVAWAPDPFARIVVRGHNDRVVGHDELKSTLKQLRAAGRRVDRVFIYAPIERLKRFELLDTPGFNAPCKDHAQVARTGIREAHLVLWLLDATAPMKDTERQVIQEIATADLPVQVLVNKRDRVAAGQLDSVMSYVLSALEKTSIQSYRPPVALSAQKALAGRLGDAEALEASHWSQVEQLLSEHIVDRCDQLKERALRRKARQIAEQLQLLVTVQAQRSADVADRQSRRREQLRAIAGQLHAEARSLAENIEASLEAAYEQLQADVRPVVQLSHRNQLADSEVKRYLRNCTVQRLAPAISQALTTQISERGLAADDYPLAELFEPRIRAAIGGAAAAFDAAPVVPRDNISRVLEVVIESCAEAVRARVDIQQAPVAEQGMLMRLTGLLTAL